MAFNSAQQQQVQEQLQRILQAFPGVDPGQAARQATVDVANANGLDPNTLGPPVAPSPPQSGLSPILQGITSDPAVSSGLEAGAALGKEFFSEGELGRIGLSPEIQAILDRNSIASQNLAQSAQGINPLFTRAAGPLQELLDIQRAQLESGSAEFQQLVAQARQQFEQSGQIDPALQEALDISRSRLDGLTASETTLLEEQGRGEINRGLQTALRVANQQGINANVTGGARGARAAPDFLDFSQALRGLQGDIGQFNIGLRDERLGAFTDLASTIDQNRFDRRTGTFENLSNLITGGEATRFDQLNRSSTSLADLLGAQATFQAGNKVATQGLANQSGFNNALLSQGIDTFNIGQQNAETAGLLGAIFGTGAFSASEAGRIAADEQARRAIEIAERF